MFVRSVRASAVALLLGAASMSPARADGPAPPVVPAGYNLFAPTVVPAAQPAQTTGPDPPAESEDPHRTPGPGQSTSGDHRRTGLNIGSTLAWESCAIVGRAAIGNMPSTV